VSSVWDERAEAYRASEAHREGEDLDLLVEWAAGGQTALDVGTGGGHVGRRLREAGLDVVTVDAAPGMRPDVVSRAEDLPFADESFDVVACRIAAHHFEDVRAAVREMARVSRDRVLVVDNLFEGEDAEEAERLRDPAHVRNLTPDEWRAVFADAGLALETERTLAKKLEVGPWLDRVGCVGEDAERVRILLGNRVASGTLTTAVIALKGRKR
jgi:SAM-dependent methyltransferase